MDIVNRIHDGVHLDNNEYDQPENTMRDNRNGVIYDSATGNYIWMPLYGTRQVLDLPADDYIMRTCSIRDRHFIFVLSIVNDYVQLLELNFGTDGSIVSTTNRWQSTNTLMQMSLQHPIRAMFGVYENDAVQRIYWTDYYNQIRCINIGSASLVVPVSPDPKFIDLVPELDNVYGSIKFAGELSGGSLRAGIYFFSWRLYKDGYYTDWSYLSNPIPVFNGAIGASYLDYQNIEGAAPNEITSKGMQLTLSDIDSDYDKIQIASFYTNDVNSLAEGKIIYENTIPGTSFSFNYMGNENAGTVVLTDIMLTSILIERCFDMTHLKKRNIIANIEERSELDLPNQLEVSIIPKQYGILLDTVPYKRHFDVPYVRELYGTRPGAQELSTYPLLQNLYHYAVTEIKYTPVALPQVTVPAGEYFLAPSGCVWNSGTGKLAIVIKKYRKSSGVAPYNLTDDYVLDTSFVENEYYNYKNPKFTEKLKGYPGGETVRLGVLFFDKTGRPFFVRHLYNTETVLDGLTIGPGDTRIPERAEDGGKFPLTICENYSAAAPEYYKTTIGMVNHFSISGLDITDVKDLIGGFAIVRCPIERQNIAFGAICSLNANGNDITVANSFRADNHDVNHYAGAYGFYCPEDMYGFSGFSIQPGDKIVNRYYMVPFAPGRSPVRGTSPGFPLTELRGFGMGMDTGSLGEYNIFQKFYVHDNAPGASGNGDIDVEHEVISYTKYKQGDGSDIPIDPIDETKLLIDHTSIMVGLSVCKSYLTNLGIAVIDIDETGDDIKGIFDLDTGDPKMLMCTIKRPNANLYGGLSDAALASSTYQSTGHFQKIDAGVLADIEDTGTYIFNEIDIFGGDTFVCIWDFMRSMINEDLSGNGFSHSVMIPIETRLNLDLREGDRIGKLRCYEAVTLETGLRWKTAFNKWEEHNYNDGYSSDTISRLYLPMPNNFVNETIFDTAIRYSNEKTYGEYEDSYRKFAALNKWTVETTHGSITNIKSKNGNLVFWQKNGVGYIPMGERALTSNDIGNAVQLGVAGIFERDDMIIEAIGNSNQFGLCESDEGFHWYDAYRKLIVTLKNSMQLTQESIVKGIDSFCILTVPNEMYLYDNPVHQYGIVSGYDPREKVVYLTFRTDSFEETIALSVKTNKAVGFFDFKTRLYFNAMNYMYAGIDTYKAIHQHGTGLVGSYHGESKDNSLTIIVKEESNLAKIFDTFELIGNGDQFFTSAEFISENGDSAIEYYTGVNSRHLKQRLSYKNKRFFGNYPKIERERIVGGYVKITFINEANSGLTPKLLQLKSSYREMI